MATELGKAYVQIIPSARGIKGKLEGLLGKPSEEAGESAGKGFGSKFSGALKGIGKGLGVALGAAATSVGVLTKQAIQSYSNYEQLVGGAKLMWGDAYTFIQDKAEAAFSNVQMSTADYLAQANYYAVGLKEALGGGDGAAAAAAELADKIITAQADIVAATGMSSEAVQNAFQGVMRGNYTMLDNLGLGIAGTKEGMQEVIDAVNKAKGLDLSLDNVADAQRALVEYVEMQGMANYAADEGAETIQGAFSSLSATWSNLITGLADSNADIGGLIDDLTGTFQTMVTLITPIMSQFATSIVEAIPGIAAAITDALPQLSEQLLPALIAGALSLTLALIEQIPVILTSVMTALVEQSEMIGQAIVDIAVALVAMTPQIIGILIQSIPLIILGIVSGISSALEPIILAGMQVITALGQGIMQFASNVYQKAGEIVRGIKQAIVQKVSDIVQAGKNIIDGLVRGITSAKDAVVNKIKEICQNALNAIKSFFGIASPAKVTRKQGRWIGLGLALGIEDEAKSVNDAMKTVRDEALGGINSDIGARVTLSSANASNYSAIVGLLQTIASKPDEVVIDLNGRQLGRGLRDMGVAFA